MKKSLANLLVVFLLVVVTAGSVGYLFFSNIQTASTSDGIVTYALVTTAPEENSIAFEGCGAEFIKLYSVNVPGTLQDSLAGLFQVTDYKIPNTNFTNSLYNSTIKSTVTQEAETTIVNLNGDLISAGTCDDPRVINQITKTIEANLPENSEYKIKLNGSEQNWRCWNDMSGNCN
jgi:hypothetical protein